MLAIIPFFFPTIARNGFFIQPENTPILDQDETYEDCQRNPVLKRTYKYKEYEVSLLRAGEETCGILNITRNGALIYHREEIGGYFYFGDQFEDRDNPMTHLARQDSPNLLISEWTGGTHCCFLYHVFDLSDRFKKIASINGVNYYPTLEDVDHDGLQEVKILDDVLAYRFADFSRTAIGEVILKYSDGRFRVAAEYMKQKAPDLNTMDKAIQSWRSRFYAQTYIGTAPSALIQNVTDLFFSGNKTAALDLIDRSWPSEVHGKKEFIKAYLDALTESEYYPEFEKQL